MALTTCRIWQFAVRGVHSSKTEAGRWALARKPSQTAVAEALYQRTVDLRAPISTAGIATLPETVQHEIEIAKVAAPPD